MIQERGLVGRTAEEMRYFAVVSVNQHPSFRKRCWQEVTGPVLSCLLVCPSRPGMPLDAVYKDDTVKVRLESLLQDLACALHAARE